MNRLPPLILLLLSCSNPVTPALDGYDLAYGRGRMEQEQTHLHTLNDVRVLMWQFTPIKEAFEFEPTVEQVFARNLVGDCQSAAVLGQWALGQINRPAKRYTLTGGRPKDHAIAVTVDGAIIISNRDVIETDNWRETALKLGDPPYEKIK